MTRPLAFVGVVGILVALALGSVGAPPAGAQSGQGVIASTDTNTPGVVAEVIECKRKEGVLTLKVRFRNTRAEDVRLNVIHSRNYDAYYLTAGSKKYFILRDAEKTPLAPEVSGGGDLDTSIPASGTWTWWAKYPAPPPEATSVNIYMPLAPPMDDVPITDS